MSSVPGWLMASRCLAAFSLLVCMHGHAASESAAKFKERVPTPVSTTSEPPSLAMLALGLVGIGWHGLRRARRHR